jgi:D-glycero-alpha-D-manno-heptose-7-phosphate kinase
MSYNFVVTQTPLRISFAGGGTDFEAFYRQEGGQVVSTTIDKFVYVTVKRHDKFLNPESYRLNYFESEHVHHVSEIKNNIIRGVLNFLEFEDPLYVSTVADVPASSGLGSSSAFAVGLLNAVHFLMGDRISLPQLAEEACHIEIELLKNPIGKQDQYATACGNLNRIVFNRNGHINIENVGMTAMEIDGVFESLLFFSTNIHRSASSILQTQSQNTTSGLNFEHLRKIKEHSQSALEILRAGFDLDKFGDLLNETWEVKKRLAGSISTAEIDQWYDRAMAAGARGGKISGAGGGGYLMFVVPIEKQDAVRTALGDLIEVKMKYEPLGSRIIVAQ